MTYFEQSCLQSITVRYLLLQANLGQQTQNICITFIQQRPNVFDVGPTLYKCYTNVLCLLGVHTFHAAGRCSSYVEQQQQQHPYDLPGEGCQVITPGTKTCHFTSVSKSTPIIDNALRPLHDKIRGGVTKYSGHDECAYNRRSQVRVSRGVNRHRRNQV